jgi:hypothetical protein
VIPPFRKITGALPPGIHEATWQEFTLRFGYNRPRRRLIIGLEQVLQDLRLAGCRRVYIDGSFVMDKPQPEDFDCCWEVEGVDRSLLPPDLLDIRYPRKAPKARYGGEIFPADEIADPTGIVYLDYFQLDTRPSKAIVKGIVALNL